MRTKTTQIGVGLIEVMVALLLLTVAVLVTVVHCKDKLLRRLMSRLNVLSH